MFNKAIKVVTGVVIAWNVYGIYKCFEGIHEVRNKMATIYQKYR